MVDLNTLYLSGRFAFINRVDQTLTTNQYLAPFRPYICLAGRLGFLLALYLAIDRSLMHLALLSPSSYHQPSLLLAIGQQLFNKPLIPIVTAAFIAIRWRSCLTPWSVFEYHIPIRLFILWVALLLAWTFSTYNYNFYLDQGHYTDRVFLVILAVCICWRPVFVGPFLLLVVALIWQSSYPLPGASVGAQFLPVRILIFWSAVLVGHALTGYKKTTDFIFLTGCLIAAQYWHPGLGKLRIDWINHAHPYFLLFATYANGWLAFLDPVTLTKFAQQVAIFDWPMRLFTLAIEGGALCFLWRRLSVMVLLSGWIVFHIGVCILSGIFFWDRIAIYGVLLMGFLFYKPLQSLPIFTRPHLVLSILIIASGEGLFKPINLTWYDTRISYTYQFEGQGPSGRHYRLPPQFFAPYEYPFTMGSFGYLPKTPHLDITWGVTKNIQLADALMAATSPEEVEQVEIRMGRIEFDAGMTNLLDAFLIQFIGNLNQHDVKSIWWAIIQAPPKLWTMSIDDQYKGEEPITSIRIYQVTSLYDNDMYREIRKTLVHTLDIPYDNGQ